MLPELALKLVPIFEAYFSIEEARELATLFDVNLGTLNAFEPLGKPPWLSVARELTANLEQGNTRRLVDSILDLADARNGDGVAHSTWERRDFHHTMASLVHDAKALLETSAAPSEIAVAAGNIFSAKSRVRELLETAKSDIFIVDPYVGLGTLDCLRNITVPIRLLTSSHPNSIEADFDRALASFQAEGHQLQVRRVPQLHDRHIVFNDRCWLVGGSLKDAGKKAFNCIEISDEKSLVIADLESKWRSGTPSP